MLYPELFASLEKVRWNMSEDIPWKDFEPSKLTEEQAAKAKERLTESITTMVNEGFKGRGPGHGGPPPGSEDEGD